MILSKLRRGLSRDDNLRLDFLAREDWGLTAEAIESRDRFSVSPHFHTYTFFNSHPQKSIQLADSSCIVSIDNSINL